MKYKKFVIAVICMAVSCQKAELEYYSPLSVNEDVSLSNPNVTCFCSDSEGYLWIGTDRGLNRYNGSLMRRYFHNPDDESSLNSNGITCLLCSSKGSLMVGTYEGLNIRGSLDDFRRVPYSGSYKSVHQLIELPDGRIIANMVEQLCLYNNESDSLEVLIDQFDPGRSYVNDCMLDSKGRIWSVYNGGVRVYSGKTFELLQEIETGIFPYYSALLDNGELWIISREGSLAIDVETALKHPIPSKLLPLAQSCIYFISSNGSGGYYIGGDDDMYFFDGKSENLFRNGENGFPLLLPHRTYNLVHVRESGEIFAASPNQGFTADFTQRKLFNNDVYLSSFFDGKIISAITLSPEGDVYAAATDNRIFKIPSDRTRNVQEFSLKGVFSSKEPNQMDLRIWVDSLSRLWAIQGERLLEFSLSESGPVFQTLHSEIPEKVLSMSLGPDGSVWVGVFGQNIYRLLPGEKRFSAFRFSDRNIAVYATCPLADGSIVIGTSMTNPLIFDPLSEKSRTIEIWEEARPSDFVSCICPDKAGNIYLGTRSSGIYSFSTKDYSISRLPDLGASEIFSLLQDSDLRLWAGTYSGLLKITPDGKAVLYTSSDGIGDPCLSCQGAVAHPCGELFFGGRGGLMVFDPHEKPRQRYVPLLFEHLSVDSRIVKPSKGSAIECQLSEAPEVRLTCKQNNFAISFASLNYTPHSNNHYYYKMDGYNSAYADIHQSTELVFPNMKPGRYLLHVKAVNSELNVEEVARSLPIIITPPWYRLWWARLCWALLAGFALAFLLRFLYRRRAEKLKRSELEKEKEAQKRLNEVNMSFFANMSHEFRTPLTMIVGPVAELSQDKDLSRYDKELLGTIRFNTARMLRLIDQVLDFGKLDSDTLKLQVCWGDLSQCLKDTLAMYLGGLRAKKIQLKTEGLEEEFYALFDPDKVDKIVSNLMSNAWRFTPEGGQISVRLDSDRGEMFIEVENSGSSIPPDRLESIFERYYQIENHYRYGTGIGLYFSRELAILHHGSLKAENCEDGVKFILELPIDDQYKESEHGESLDPNSFVKCVCSEELEKERLDTATVPNDGAPCVLVVDDDPGVVEYIAHLFENDYKVEKAFSAVEGLKILEEVTVDVIVSDVSMPQMDGYEFCSKVKDNIRTSHIPVVLLTAKVARDEQLRGLKIGAEAYVLKPFDPEYLLAIVQSQIENRQKVRTALQGVTSTENMEEKLSAHDKIFMDKFFACLEADIESPELNITKVCSDLAMSRSKLFYIVKGLTGETPGVFFKKYKLNRSAELLRSGDYNISEVADITGWSSLALFSRNFKQHFGITPTEYLKNTPRI